MHSLCESREFLKERIPCLNLFFRAASFTNTDRQASSSSLTCTAFSSHFFFFLQGLFVHANLFVEMLCAHRTSWSYEDVQCLLRCVLFLCVFLTMEIAQANYFTRMFSLTAILVMYKRYFRLDKSWVFFCAENSVRTNRLPHFNSWSYAVKQMF